MNHHNAIKQRIRDRITGGNTMLDLDKAEREYDGNWRVCAVIAGKSYLSRWTTQDKDHASGEIAKAYDWIKVNYNATFKSTEGDVPTSSLSLMFPYPIKS